MQFVPYEYLPAAFPEQDMVVATVVEVADVEVDVE